MNQPRRPKIKRRGRSRRGIRGRERGVALVLVLGTITVLTVFLTQLQEDTSSELASALAERDALKAEYYARSAVNLTRLVLATEPTIQKTLQPIYSMVGVNIQQTPVWDFLDYLLGPFNDTSSTQAFMGAIGGDPTLAKNLGITGGGRFEVVVVDESSKINVNAAGYNTPTLRDRLGEQLLGLMAPVTNNPLFEGRDSDNQFSDRQTICGAIVDWADSESSSNETQYPCDPKATNAVASGPEDNFYQTIGLAYRRKNAAFDSLDELRLVRGINDDFWATFVDPAPDDPKKRIMTVWGGKTINVASANPQTLLALACANAPADAELCTDPAQSAAFLMGLSMAKSFVPIPLLGSPQDFIDALAGKGMLGQLLASFNIKPIKFKNPNDVKSALSGRTNLFSIYAVGVVPGYKRTTKVKIHAVIDRHGASQLGTLTVPGSAPSSTPTKAGPTSPATGSTTTGSNQMPQVFMDMSAAGTVVYWRVE